MKKRTKKWRSIICLMTLCAMLLSACGDSTPSGVEEIDLSSYPIASDVELTYWKALTTNVSANFANFGDTEFAKELERQTGIKVNYQHPAQGQSSEALALMIASNEMADMIQTNWTGVMGGPEIAIRDNVILRLNDLIDKYAPNLKKFLKENPDIDKEIKTDSGDYYVVPSIRYDEKMLVSNGPVVRRDWLDELGLGIPETVDEVEKVLKTFKEEKGAEAPLTISSTEMYKLINLCGGQFDFYLDGDKVVYGPIAPQCKDAVIRLRNWFEMGLLDKNFVSNDTTMVDANMLNGVSGLTYASGGSGVGKWLDTMEAKNEAYDVVGMPIPVLEKGDPVPFVIRDNKYIVNGSVAISSSCKYPELAIKFLDYGFSEKGHDLYNFGIEGVSFNWEDGYPKYTDEIMNNPDGLPVSQAMGKYILACNNGPFVQDMRYMEQYYEKPQQKESLENWTKDISTSSYKPLPILSYTEEESSEYANIMNEVNKYRDEMVSSYIMGAQDISTYDKYLKRLNALKVERAVEIVQAAYDRYKAR